MRKQLLFTTALLALGTSSSALATNFTGTVDMLETWPSGNVAFTLNGATGPCNGQFILNHSSAGTKNLYALLLAAKSTGKQVMVVQSTCGAADGYGGSYGLVDYLYLL